MKRALFVIAGLALAGCENPLGPQESELEANVETWADADVAAYEYHFRRLCFCGPDTTREVIIEVILGNVARVLDAETGEELPDPGSYPAIEDLFAEIQDAIDREAETIDVSYDDRLGYPLSAFFDYVLNAADEEMAWEVTDFIEIDVINLGSVPSADGD